MRHWASQLWNWPRETGDRRRHFVHAQPPIGHLIGATEEWLTIRTEGLADAARLNTLRQGPPIGSVVPGYSLRASLGSRGIGQPGPVNRATCLGTVKNQAPRLMT